MIDINELIKTGLDHHQKGRLSQALETYQAVLQEYPKDSDALHLSGLAEYQLGKNETAIALIQKAIDIKPDEPRFHDDIGLVFVELGRLDEAAYAFKKALFYDQNNDDTYNNVGNVFYQKGDFEEAIKNYQHAIKFNPNNFEAYNNIGAALKAMDRIDSAIDYYKKALRIKPDAEEIYFNLGVAFNDQCELDAAINNYHKAVALNPDYAEAYNNLGTALNEQGKFEEAIENYNTAVRLKPGYAEALNNLGSAFNDMGKYDEAVEKFKQALQIEPDSAEIHYNIGNNFKGKGEYEKAIEKYKNAIALNSGYAAAHWNMGLTCLLLGRYKEGWMEYEWRFKKAEHKTIYSYKLDLPRWNGLSFAGKRLLIHDEQGFGDTIQFVRYLPIVKALGGTVIFETRKPLINILRGFPGIDELVERSNDKEAYTGCDLYMPLLSLPGIFNTTVVTIPDKAPYLYADSGKKDYWLGRLKGDGLKVGLVWAGKAGHLNDKNRSCRLEHFLPLSHIKGIQLYGLQKGDVASQIERLPEGLIQANLGEEFEDFSDTAGIIESLDLVITVDTAAAHLAGAMGKPVWTLLPFAPDWRWMLDREDSPWYPTMRLFRQKKAGDWDEVISFLAEELKRLLS